MKKRRKKKIITKITFSKTWVNRLLWMSVIDIQLSYVLAFLGREQIAEKLSIAALVNILGVLIPYFCKSFFETKEEESNKLIYDYRQKYMNQNFNSLYEDENQENDDYQEESMR